MRLPQGMQVFQRDWLSSNNILFVTPNDATLVDTGYVKHAEQTLALVQHALGERPLTRIINTHLHSDHCGGNALLQSHFPQVQTWISHAERDAVLHWDATALSFAATGQDCPRYHFDATLSPGQTVVLGELAWQVHAAAGHDPHSLLFFEAESKTLISADALWENGFGVVFPELSGEPGFADVVATLDLIESLQAKTVIPGHGAVFTDVDQALAFARQRIAYFIANPRSHASHAAKVLLKFKLMDWQSISREAFAEWSENTPYLHRLHQAYFVNLHFHTWLTEQLQALETSKAIVSNSTHIHNI